MSLNGQTPRQHESSALGEIFNNAFIIGKISSSKGHCDVYEVQRLESGTFDAQRKLEARVFDLTGLSGSYAKLRRRSMRRLAKRSVLKTKWRHLDVVIYTVDDYLVVPTIRDDGENMNNCGTSGSELQGSSGESSNAKGDSKSTWENSGIQFRESNSTAGSVLTFHQRESRRLRQKDRRQGARALRAEDESNSNPHSRTWRPMVPRDIGFDESTFTMFELLHFVKGNGQYRLTEGLRSIFDLYWDKKDDPPVITDISDMREFIQLKESEIISLQRQLNKIPSAINKVHAELNILYRQQTAETQDTEYTWKTSLVQEKRIEQAQLQWEVLRTCQRFLPTIVRSAVEQRSSVQKSLREGVRMEKELTRQRRMEMEFEKLSKEEHCLMRKTKNYEDWRSSSMPASASSTQLENKAQATRQDAILLYKEIEKLDIWGHVTKGTRYETVINIIS